MQKFICSNLTTFIPVGFILSRATDSNFTCNLFYFLSGEVSCEV